MNERRKAYMAEYTKRPEVRLRRLRYDRAYRNKFVKKPKNRPTALETAGDAHGNEDMIVFQRDAREADQRMQELLFMHHRDRFVESF